MRTTLVGSMMPFVIILPNSPVCASSAITAEAFVG
jgi:hypothetical protein